MQDKSAHVVVIGAGPAGVAAAIGLQQRGISFTLLEEGNVPFASLRRIDPDMELLSPTGLNRLPHMQREKTPPIYPRFRDYIAELDRYLQEHHLHVETNSRIENVTSTNGRFEVTLASGKILYASHVVNATGIIHSPNLPPDFRPSDVRFPWKHSIDVRADDLKDVKELLVIGGGASAAEVLDRWLEVRQPDSHANLSLQRKLRAFTNPILGLDVHYWIWLHEHLPSIMLGAHAYKLPELMNGTRVLPAIKRGWITPVGKIVTYSGDTVVLDSGETLKPDFVAFSTGFTYSVDHLRDLLDHYEDGYPRVRNCESTKTRRLFLLGFKYGRTFASPYIRGIARDAKYVVRRIARTL